MHIQILTGMTVPGMIPNTVLEPTDMFILRKHNAHKIFVLLEAFNCISPILYICKFFYHQENVKIQIKCNCTSQMLTKY